MASGAFKGLTRAAEVASVAEGALQAADRLSRAYSRYSRSGAMGNPISLPPGVSPFGPAYNYSRRNATRPGTGRANVGLWQGRLSSAREELKFHDEHAHDSISISNTASWTSLPLLTIPSGAGENLRTGRKINIKSIALRMVFGYHGDLSSGIPVDDDVVRVLLVQDRQANGTAPVLSDVLETATQPDVFAFNNLSNKNRFRILMDKTHDLHYTAAGSETSTGTNFAFAGPQKSFSFYKKCNIPIEYSGPTGALGEIRSNNLLLVVIRNETQAALFFTWNWRVRFTD